MTTPPTDQQLDDIETRHTAATPGPWFLHADWPGRVFAESEFNHHVARVTGSNPESNERFIAHAREDVPLLLAEVRRLQGQRRYLIDQLARKDARSGEADEKLREFRGGEPQTAPDTLPAWLYQRFMVSGVGWDNLDADDRAYWEHQARAVRRAVARGGFKAVAPDASSASTGAPLGVSPASSVSESAQIPTGASEGRLGDLPSTEDPAPAETLIGSITIRSESVQLDNGECLRDLAVGDSVELRPDTGDEGLWIVAAFHGDYQEQITLQYAEVVDDCGNDPVIACKFSGTRHAHPVDLDGKVRPRPTP